MKHSDHLLRENDRHDALEFLREDFAQCFQQMRHYDSQILDIFKFVLSTYIAVAGVSLGTYQFGLSEHIDMRLTSAGVLVGGLCLGLCLLGVVVRNRNYFVHMARFINEQRAFYLATPSLGFANISRLYTDPTQPRFCDLKSSHLWLVYAMALTNSVLLGVLVFILGVSNVWVAGGLGVVALVSQLSAAILYLRSKESQGAEEAVFGRTAKAP